MKKLTKKQHRAIIASITDKIQDVHDLRSVQKVAEIFEEDEKLREDGSISNSAESIRLLLDLFEYDRIAEVCDMLYNFWEKVQEGIDGDNIYAEIDDMLHELDIKSVLFVHGLVKNISNR